MMLQKKNRPLYKNPLVWLITILAILIVIVVLEKTRVTDFIKIPPTPGSEAAQEADQKKADDSRKQEFIEKAPEATPATPPESSDSITLNTTQEGSSVTILTKLKDFSGGSCALSITNGAKTYSASADIIYQPEFSSCAGFSVPVSQLGTGQWSITLKATPTGGTTLSKSTNHEVK